MKYSGGPLDSQTWQTEWKTAPVQWCEQENQTLEAIVAAIRLYTKFDCPVRMIASLAYPADHTLVHRQSPERQRAHYDGFLKVPIVSVMSEWIPYIMLSIS